MKKLILFCLICSLAMAQLPVAVPGSPGPGGGVTAGGSNTSIQTKSGSNLAGDLNFTWDGTTFRVVTANVIFGDDSQSGFYKISLVADLPDTFNTQFAGLGVFVTGTDANGQYVFGTEAFATTSGPGHHSTATGLYGKGEHDGSGILDAAHGVEAQVQEFGSGGRVITEAIDFYAFGIDNGYQITDAKGIKVLPIQDGTASNYNYWGAGGDGGTINVGIHQETGGAGSIGEEIMAAAAQTANLFQLLNSGGTPITFFDADGNLLITAQKATTGQVFLCIDTDGQLVAKATACVGTL